MEEVTFELKGAKSASFTVHRADGSALVLKGGEPRSFAASSEETQLLREFADEVREVKKGES